MTDGKERGEPGFFRWVLRRLTPPKERGVVIGELAELFQERLARDGRWRAGWWYRRQVVGFVARGWAVRRFGDRNSRSGGRMGSWSEVVREVRWALRGMVQRPTHTAVIVVTLALGIGAATAVLTLVNAHFFIPLPYERPDELVLLWETDRNSDEPTTVSPGNYHTWREDTSSFTDVAAFNVATATLSGDALAEEVSASVVVPHFFDVLGVRPVLGRGFSEEAVRAADGRLVILSHGLWTRRYGANPDLVGSDIRVDGRPYTVVGILGPEYRQPERSLRWQAAELWRPLLLDGQEEDYDSRYLRTIARRRPGVSVERARSEMEAVASRMADAHPNANGGRTILVRTLPDYLMGQARPVLLVLLAAGAAVLLIVCANVANLTLARGEERRKEFAVRAALGSGTGRLVRQIVVEGLVLSLAGAGLGLLLILAGRDLLQVVQERYFTGLVDVALDGRVILATAGLALATGLLSSLPSGRLVSGTRLRSALAEGGRRAGGSPGSRRTRNLLIVGQVGLATMLVLVAALLTRSFGELVSVPPGFRAEGLMTLRVSAPSVRYESMGDVEAFYRELERSLEETPGVEGVSFVTDLPFTTSNWSTAARVAGIPWDPEDPPTSEYRITLPGYFEVMEIPVERGSLPETGWEAEEPAPVVVNRALADSWWPDADPLGRSFVLQWSDTFEVRVVAVVGNVRDDGFDSAPEPLFYLPWATAPNRFMYAMVRATGDPRTVMASVRSAVDRVDPEIPAADLRLFTSLMGRSVARPRASSLVGVVFATLALLVAATGIYGVLSYSVQSRTREIGIRAALGASGGELASMVVGQSTRLVVLGLIAGTAGALVAGSMLSDLLFGVHAWDPASILVTVVMLGGVALSASWIPARRAVRTDPRSALLAE